MLSLVLRTKEWLENVGRCEPFLLEAVPVTADMCPFSNSDMRHRWDSKVPNLDFKPLISRIDQVQPSRIFVPRQRGRIGGGKQLAPSASIHTFYKPSTYACEANEAYVEI